MTTDDIHTTDVIAVVSNRDRYSSKSLLELHGHVQQPFKLLSTYYQYIKEPR